MPTLLSVIFLNITIGLIPKHGPGNKSDTWSAIGATCGTGGEQAKTGIAFCENCSNIDKHQYFTHNMSPNQVYNISE